MFRIVIAAGAGLLAATALLEPATATAAPTCTPGDLATRVGYRCRLAPWAPLPDTGQSPSYPHCEWLPSDWNNSRFDVTRTCRAPDPPHW